MGIEEMRACTREKDRETENGAARKQMKIRKHENQNKTKQKMMLVYVIKHNIRQHPEGVLRKKEEKDSRTL